MSNTELKISDFGLAKMSKDGAGEVRWTSAFLLKNTTSGVKVLLVPPKISKNFKGLQYYCSEALLSMRTILDGYPALTPFVVRIFTWRQRSSNRRTAVQLRL